jgi:hypothetical protein
MNDGGRCGCPHAGRGGPNTKTLGSAMEASDPEGEYVRRGIQMTVTVTPRPPVNAAAHAFSLPVVREIPPVQRPGTFSATW